MEALISTVIVLIPLMGFWFWGRYCGISLMMKEMEKELNDSDQSFLPRLVGEALETSSPIERLYTIMQKKNPYKVYSVVFPYEVRFTIPEDDHNTEIIIKTKTRETYFGKNKDDVLLQKEFLNHPY